MTAIDIDQANREFANADPLDIVSYAIRHAGGRAIVSTNFRPGEAAILHLVTRIEPEIPVLWVDHGYNTPETYRFAQRLIETLQLRVVIESPDVTTAYRDAALGGIPAVEDEEAHRVFTEERKLAPFRRGMQRIDPAVWFTAVRREQTALRANMQPFALEGAVVKVAPILAWSEADLQAYLAEHGLPDERTYFDPTKVGSSRECGLHEGLYSKQR